MARESRPTYGNPAQQAVQQPPLAAQAQQVVPDPDAAQAALVNQIVGMVLQRVNVQVGQDQQPAIEANVFAALAQAVLRPPPLGEDARNAIDTYIALARALTHN